MRVGGSSFRPPIWSYMNRPSRSSHAGRRPAWCGSTKSQRPDDVGSDLPEDFALDQRFADQPELVIFEIAQAAMHQFRRPRRGAAGQVVHFTKENRVSPAGRIAGDAAAIDAAANDREVENLTQGRSPHAFRVCSRFAVQGILRLSLWIKAQPKAKATWKAEQDPLERCTCPGRSAARSSCERGGTAGLCGESND